ncbi:MAG: hydroxymethylglutaryl-CoA synthase family protein [Bacteroidota bacterium]
MFARSFLSVGIDDIAAHLPHIYLKIEDLSIARNIEYAKLNKGLGLTNMSLADVHEDAATMAANAVRKLIEQNDLNPSHIGRIYLGTESALDGSKPTASYALDMLNHYFSPKYGPDCFLNCDVVDLTFACIGAVDALQNSLDWVRTGEDRIAIVIGSDVAKYELASTGEYTQGAGAIALLVKENPRLLAFDEQWGVATRPVHDFFKPIRTVQKNQLLTEIEEKGIGQNLNFDIIEYAIFLKLYL